MIPPNALPAIRWLRFVGVVAGLASLSNWSLAQPRGENGKQWKVAADIQAVMKTKPNVDVASVGRQGVPTAVVGKLGRIAHSKEAIIENDLVPVVADIAPAFRLKRENLHLQRIQVDELGSAHAIYGQVKNGLEVVGARLSLHIDQHGGVYAAFGNARDGEDSLPVKPSFGAEVARSQILAKRRASANASGDRLVYVITSKDQSMHLAWESHVTGSENGVAIDERDYVDAVSGEIVEVQTNIWPLMSRKVYKNGGYSTWPGYPGTPPSWWPLLQHYADYNPDVSQQYFYQYPPDTSGATCSNNEPLLKEA